MIESRGLLVVVPDKRLNDIVEMYVGQAAQWEVAAKPYDWVSALETVQQWRLSGEHSRVSAAVLEGNMVGHRYSNGEIIPVKKRFDQSILVARAIKGLVQDLPIIGFGNDPEVMEEAFADYDIELYANVGRNFAEIPDVLGKLSVLSAA